MRTCIPLATLLFLAVASLAEADNLVPLTNEYTIGVTATPLGAQSWEFAYAVTNNNQGDNLYEGFNGFSIQVPISATISNVSIPPACGKFGGPNPHWVYLFCTDLFDVGDSWHAPALAGYEWLNWQAQYDDYPPGATVTFSFQADGVDLGNTPAAPFTYWYRDVPSYPYFVNSVGCNYTVFSTNIVGPVAVPEPSTLVLLGIGAFGLLAWAWRRNRKAV